ncbi:MAG: trimethylamine methyltransferase family protein [Candidatus Methanomethylophilaceae archaeon]|nr:trimethylamine methyltransferase family protein [Candidatus Methanomethylophilaceae archaeon]MBR2348416.1 trimethylamine methyltransferase family protein [Candidatus Methanomethylophilaceae archaeon]MBR2394261.1 trimethylamine methyltransferase family protein [Candidatus Methanomethylophilaceae archaeon]
MPDSQAAHEKTITSLLPAIAGANSIYGSGMLELGQTFSMEQLVIDNDIIAMNFRAMEGIPVTDDTLAVAATKEVGVGNDFLGHITTMENFEMASNPAVFDRTMLGEWRANGSKNAVERAHDVVVDVMANYEVLPIEAETLAAMEAIVKKADEAFVKRMQE